MIIHDNLKKKIFYIINIFNDEKISNYKVKYLEIESEINDLLIQASLEKNNSIKLQKLILKLNLTHLKTIFKNGQ